MRFIKTTIYFSFLFLVLPMLSLAQGNPFDSGNTNQIGQNSGGPLGQNSGGISQNSGGPSGSNGEVSLMNPLGNKTLMEFIQDILDVILVFAVPLIVFFIILAGFNFVMARGNDGKLESAKKA